MIKMYFLTLNTVFSVYSEGQKLGVSVRMLQICTTLISHTWCYCRYCVVYNVCFLWELFCAALQVFIYRYTQCNWFI